MKIKITKTCECMYDSLKMAEAEDCRLNQGTILEGELIPCFNWNKQPIDASDLEMDNGNIYLAIPNDSFITL